MAKQPQMQSFEGDVGIFLLCQRFQDFLIILF